MGRHAPGIPVTALERMTPEESRYLAKRVSDDLKGELNVQIALAKLAAGPRMR